MYFFSYGLIHEIIYLKIICKNVPIRIKYGWSIPIQKKFGIPEINDMFGLLLHIFLINVPSSQVSATQKWIELTETF